MYLVYVNMAAPAKYRINSIGVDWERKAERLGVVEADLEGFCMAPKLRPRVRAARMIGIAAPARRIFWETSGGWKRG